MPIPCTVCTHPKREAIDEALALGGISNRQLAARHNLNERAMDRHKKTHLPARILRAVERRQKAEAERPAKIQAKKEDSFLDRMNFLMDESKQYVLDAHGAVKMQKVTVKEEQPDGSIVKSEEYREFRDIGAMAPALTAAKSITELYGQATGELNKTQDLDRKPFVVIIANQQVSHRSVAESIQASHATYDPSQQSPLLEDAQTIDVRALAD